MPASLHPTGVHCISVRCRFFFFSPNSSLLDYSYKRRMYRKKLVFTLMTDISSHLYSIAVYTECQRGVKMILFAQIATAATQQNNTVNGGETTFCVKSMCSQVRPPSQKQLIDSSLCDKLARLWTPKRENVSVVWSSVSLSAPLAVQLIYDSKKKKAILDDKTCCCNFTGQEFHSLHCYSSSFGGGVRSISKQHLFLGVEHMHFQNRNKQVLY